MKKKMVLLMSTLLLMVLMTGCFKLEAGIIINADGSGEIYNKSLVAETFQEGSTSEDIFDFTNATRTPIAETVKGEKYVGELTTQKFNSISELIKISEDGIEIKTDGNTTTLSITMENEDIAEEIGSKEMIEIMKANIDAKFKITVPGEILNTNGVISGKTVTWDLLNEANANKLYVKYEDSLLPIVPPVQIKQVKVTINGKQVNFVDQDPVIIDSRTLVPIRMISEELGMEVEWNNETRTAKIFNDERSIFIKIGERDVITYHELNGNTIVLDVPAQIINGRTMVPLRAISEILDIQVDWDQSTYTAILVK